MLKLLHQFPFKDVTLKHKQVGDYNSITNSVFVNPGIVVSLVVVVIVSGIKLLFF